MVLVRIADQGRVAARQAAREITLWTTRDGREIPVDDMSCEHVANAIRVLALWRARLKKRARSGVAIDDGTLRDLTDAIARFKAVRRRRGKAAPVPTAATNPQSSTGSRFSRRRKPEAST